MLRFLYIFFKYEILTYFILQPATVIYTTQRVTAKKKRVDVNAELNSIHQIVIPVRTATSTIPTVNLARATLMVQRVNTVLPLMEWYKYFFDFNLHLLSILLYTSIDDDCYNQTSIFSVHANTITRVIRAKFVLMVIIQLNAKVSKRLLQISI